MGRRAELHINMNWQRAVSGGLLALLVVSIHAAQAKVAPGPEPCVLYVTGKEILLGSANFTDRKALAERNNVPLDCMWVITVEPEWKIQLNFTNFKLQKPNECDANFVDVFDNSTDIPSRLKNFCGSIAGTMSSNTNKVFIRFYVEPRAMNSSFNCIVTAYREKGGKPCREDEYDCEDERCIDDSLRCNGQVNCRFRWDEDEATCPGRIDNETVLSA